MHPSTKDNGIESGNKKYGKLKQKTKYFIKKMNSKDYKSFNIFLPTLKIFVLIVFSQFFSSIEALP